MSNTCWLRSTCKKIKYFALRFQATRGFFGSGTIDQQLRRYLQSTAAFIALLTPDSVTSPWVLFEIGAAWATSKTFIPIMGPGVTFGDLPAALKNYPAFKVLDTPGRLRDAVKQISSELGIAEKSSGKVEVRMRNFFKTLEEWRPSTPPQVTLDRETVRTQVKIVLEATCRAPIHPHTLTGYPIRAQCRIANTRDKRLEPFCSWSYLIPPDKGLSVDYEGPDKDVLVIAKAYRSNRILAEDLPSNHNELYTGGHKGMIWPELRSVLAAPIRDPAGDTSLPIGVISFDSSKLLSRVRFHTPEGFRLADRVAGFTYTLLRELRAT